MVSASGEPPPGPAQRRVHFADELEPPAASPLPAQLPPLYPPGPSQYMPPPPQQQPQQQQQQPAPPPPAGAGYYLPLQSPPPPPPPPPPAASPGLAVVYDTGLTANVSQVSETEVRLLDVSAPPAGVARLGPGLVLPEKVADDISWCRRPAQETAAGPSQPDTRESAAPHPGHPKFRYLVGEFKGVPLQAYTTFGKPMSKEAYDSMRREAVAWQSRLDNRRQEVEGELCRQSATHVGERR